VLQIRKENPVIRPLRSVEFERNRRSTKFVLQSILHATRVARCEDALPSPTLDFVSAKVDIVLWRFGSGPFSSGYAEGANSFALCIMEENARSKLCGCQKVMRRHAEMHALLDAFFREIINGNDLLLSRDLHMERPFPRDFYTERPLHRDRLCQCPTLDAAHIRLDGLQNELEQLAGLRRLREGGVLDQLAHDVLQFAIRNDLDELPPSDTLSMNAVGGSREPFMNSRVNTPSRLALSSAFAASTATSEGSVAKMRSTSGRVRRLSGALGKMEPPSTRRRDDAVELVKDLTEHDGARLVSEACDVESLPLDPVGKGIGVRNRAAQRCETFRLVHANYHGDACHESPT
jgi:hypothetical protein